MTLLRILFYDGSRMLFWVSPLLLLASADTQTPNPDRKTIGHLPALPRYHQSSLTVLHLSMYTNSICGNQCTYHYFHNVSLPKQPDCSRGSANLQLYHSLAARPAVAFALLFSLSVLSCLSSSIFLSITKQHGWLGADGLP